MEDVKLEVATEHMEAWYNEFLGSVADMTNDLTCLVCDVDHERSKCKVVPISQLPPGCELLAFSEYEKRTGVALHDDVKNYYTIDAPALRGLLVSPHARQSDGRVAVCTTCFSALCAKRLPRLAIANGLAVGRLPDRLASVPGIEWYVLSPAHAKVFLTTIATTNRKVL